MVIISSLEVGRGRELNSVLPDCCFDNVTAAYVQYKRAYNVHVHVHAHAHVHYVRNPNLWYIIYVHMVYNIHVHTHVYMFRICIRVYTVCTVDV